MWILSTERAACALTAHFSGDLTKGEVGLYFFLSVGQAYEAVAVLVAVPTFGGVIASLVVRCRDEQAGREQTASLTQIERARIAIEYQDLAGADGTLPRSTRSSKCAYMMINLSVCKWRSLFGLGHLSDGGSGYFFPGSSGVRGRVPGGSRLESHRVGVRGRRRRFFEIAHAEYSPAVSRDSRDAEAPKGRSVLPGRDRDLVKAGIVLLGAAATGAISGRQINRNRRLR
jgi:hypothetical protein